MLDDHDGNRGSSPLPEDVARLRDIAARANTGPHHIYTNPRDDNNWQANLDYQTAATPQLVLGLIEKAYPEATGEDEAAILELAKLTFAVQHNPNCASPYLVRLPGKGPIDMKAYSDGLGFVAHKTGDILGFGQTFGEAARKALAAAKKEQD